MQIPIINGIYASGRVDFRTSYPRNLTPVPKVQGVSAGYLRPADGIKTLGVGPGVDRGGINWKGVLHRVMGTKLVKIDALSSVTVLGDVGEGGRCIFDYSFDYLAVASGGRLYLWNGVTLKQITDRDLGQVIDFKWISGYFLATDGKSLVVTELNDPFSVNPLKYGSSETDPDDILAVHRQRNEIYSFGRYTTEVYQNAGGAGFPFVRIEGAQIARGIVGTHALCSLNESFAFCGSARNEPPSVYIMAPGQAVKIATREIETLLLDYTESELATSFMEYKRDKGHEHILLHLPNQSLVYDVAASAIMQEPIWFILCSGTEKLGQYRAQGHVWCYDRWNVADTKTNSFGYMTDNVSSHFGEVTGWEFATNIIYNSGNDAIFHELELVCLTGDIAPGSDPVIWTQYTVDGVTWSQERSTKVGKQGDRLKRIMWRTQGRLGRWRGQRFRGNSDAHIAITRLEAKLEPLNTR